MNGKTILRWDAHSRSRALGLLIAALRRADAVEIETSAREISALPFELRVLIDTKAVRAARGASMGLGLLGSRAAMAGFALRPLLVAGAMSGAALGVGLLSGVLHHYAFRLAARSSDTEPLRIEGWPRPSREGNRATD